MNVDIDVATRRRQCTNAAAHTPCPAGHIAWHTWSDKMRRTHRQKRCPVCGLFVIWVAKKKKRKQQKELTT